MRENRRQQILYRHLLRVARGRGLLAGNPSQCAVVERNFPAVLACTHLMHPTIVSCRKSSAND
jgi:hypothetical protein